MRFSVVVPAHNPDINQLSQCLRSIVSQIRPEHHQILIIDDWSDDPIFDWSIMKGIGRGVEVHRTGEDMGGLGATNLGLSLATGDYIHVIHPDDWVLSGFYAAVASHVNGCRASLYVTDYVYTAYDGCVFAPAPLAYMRRTSNSTRLVPPLHDGNPFAVAGCVISRDFYESHGGWHPSLYHTADWEYWVRASVKGSVAHVTPGMPLAAYRHHPENHSHRLMKDASNLRNYLECARVVEGYAPELVDWPKFRSYVADRARQQAAMFRQRGDEAAVLVNEAFAREVEASNG